MKGHIERGYFGGIFFEFALQNRNADAIIILPDFPSRNKYDSLISFFYNRGYHVFVPRYRGSYQSNGKFLSKNVVDDLSLFVDDLEKGQVKSLWDMKKKEFKINRKLLIGHSFSGPIALGLAAKSPRFSHIILMSPIWDFSKYKPEGEENDLKKISEFVQRAYKNCYRYTFKDMVKKLNKFKELNSEFYLQPLIKTPILVMHDPNDKIVPFKYTKEKLGELQNATYIEHLLGHKFTDSLINSHWQMIDKFIKINYFEKRD